MFAEQFAQASDDLARAQIVAPNVCEDCSQFVALVRAGVEQQVTRIRVAEDGAQGLIDLVGNGAREFAGHGKTTNVRQLRSLCLLCPLGQDSPSALIDQRYDERSLGRDDNQCHENLSPVLTPDRDFLEP
jgi:hypothetical protein